MYKFDILWHTVQVALYIRTRIKVFNMLTHFIGDSVVFYIAILRFLFF